MNADDHDPPMESLLRGTPLREPSDALDARLDLAFAQHRSRQPRRIWLRPLALAAGVLIAAGIGLLVSRPKLPKTDVQPPSVALKPSPDPIRLERDISTLYDDGIVASTDDAAYEQFRRRTVREIWYVDPTTNARTKMTVPTEELLIEKVDAF
jgi:hypothetical protein